MRDNTVDIVLASYNGSAYIREQILSIYNQSYPHWNLLITDDGSDDNTLKVVKELVNELKINHKVELLEKRDKCYPAGPAGNFIYGLSFCKSDYIMFSDQDDVWLPDKIEKQLQSIMEMPLDQPALSFCDSKVVDSELQTLNPSFIESEGFTFEHPLSLNKLLFQNVAPGCCMIINNSLKELFFSTKESHKSIVMHDWYLLILANIFGNISFVTEPLMLYRQHSNNQVGVTKKTKIHNIKNLADKVKKSLINHKKSKSQISEINRLYGFNADNSIVAELDKSFSKNYTFRLFTLLKFRVRKSTFLKTVLLYCLI